MNEELIVQLKEEREKLYPNGCPTKPRGNSKTYLYLSHFLRYFYYDLVCQIYSVSNVKYTMEDAHKDINDFVIWQMPD